MESFTPVVQSTFIEPCRASTLNANLFKNVIPPPAKEEKLASYLRIRPIPDLTQSPFLVQGQYLYARPPKVSKAFKNLKDGETGERCYTFNHIFDKETTQDEFYQGTTRPLVDRVLKGESSLLFAYGTTNSGKSFTMKGNDDNLGVIPRALNDIFDILGDKVSQRPLYKPGNRGFGEADPLLETSLKKDKDIARFIFSNVKSSNSTLSSFHTLSKSTIESIEISNYERETTFSVWISFVEFYMDNLKDLLAVEEKGKKPDQLLLAADANENYFVKGLRQVPVTTADEAIKCLLFGWDSLHRAATQLNHDSSRSHCIFTISLISYDSSPHCPNVRFVSSLSFCDLAGSERGARTGNTGERLREAAKINNSLMVLNRCVTALRANQKKEGRQLVVPFRESPLTKFFKSYFGGTGFATMIININPSVEYYDETLISLQFSTDASEITVNSKEVRERFKNSVCRLTQQWMQSSQRWSNFAPADSQNHLSTIINDESSSQEEVDFGDDDEKTVEYLNALQQSCLENDDPDTLKLLAQYIERINEDFEKEKLGWEVQVRKEVAAEIEDLYRQKSKEHEKKIENIKRDYEQEERKTKEWYRDRIRTLKLENAEKENKFHRQIEELSKKLEEKEKLLAEKDAEYRKARDENETIISQLTDLETSKEVNLQKMQQENENRFDQLQHELDENKQQLSLLKEQLMTCQQESQNLQDENAKLKAHLDAVEGEKSKFNEEKLKLTHQVDQLHEESKISASESVKLREHVTQLLEEVRTLREENENLTCEVAKFKNENDKLSGEVVKFKEEISELTRQNRQNMKMIELKDELLEKNEKELSELKKQQKPLVANIKPTVILDELPATESNICGDDVKIVSRKNCKRKQAPVTVDPYLQALKKSEIEATPKVKRVKEDEDDSNITEDESEEDEISTMHQAKKNLQRRNLRPRTTNQKSKTQEQSARKKIPNTNSKALQSPSPASSQEVEQDASYLPPTGRKTRAKRANAGQKNVKKSLF